MVLPGLLLSGIAISPLYERIIGPSLQIFEGTDVLADDQIFRMPL
jgi:hypothetical protein